MSELRTLHNNTKVILFVRHVQKVFGENSVRQNSCNSVIVEETFEIQETLWKIIYEI
jgi:hypothetical protein